MKQLYSRLDYLSKNRLKQNQRFSRSGIRSHWVLPILFLCLLFGGTASAVTYRYPTAITAFTGGLNYCHNRAAQPLTLTYSTTTCGAGGTTNVAITVTWYSNTVNSTVGGTAVQTVTSTAATTTFVYVPLTTSVGTLYYYATISWATIGCVTAGSLTTAATQPVTISSCPQSADMPDAPSNLKTVPAGSYVIPMDNEHQNLWLTYPFNIKAYGLVDSLLLNDIPVYWVIKSGKAKDSSDFSAVASRVYPTTTAAALQYFKAGEFIIDTTWLNKSYYSGEKTALQIITPFANRWKVAVYKLSSNTTVDVRYTLHQRPKIACFNNGTYQLVATKLLDSAKMGNFVAISAGVFTGLADCYTFCTEMHWSTATLADSATMAPVWEFIQEGGNFMGQCAGENTYENLMQTPRHFQTTNGTTQHNPGTLPPNYYSNADMAFAQFEGSVVPRSGTTADWTLAAASSPDTQMYTCMTSVSRDTIVASVRHYGNVDSVGGNVFFLGGHDYMSSTATSSDADSVGAIRYINGSRMFLNACLIPSHRPTAFVLDPGTNQTICTGDSVKLGGSPTGPAGSTYSWTPATGLSNATAANPMASPTVTTTYTVIAFDGSCEGGPNTVTVTVNPKPATPTAGSNSPVCAGSTLNLTTPTVVGATYSWTGPNSFSSTAQNPSITNAAAANAGTYTVTVTVGGCTSAPGTVTVVVNPTPTTPTAGSNSPICSGSTLNLTTPTVVGATYSWTGPNAFSSSSQNPSITNATTLASGTYSVTVTVAGCTSAAGTVTVIVNPTPATPTAGSNSPICSGSTLNLTTPTVVGATYSWTGPNAFSSSSQNPTITNATVAASGTYSVTVTVGGCTSAAGTVTVTVNPTPATPTAGSNSPICAGSTLNLTTPTVGGATYSWTGPNSFSSSSQNPSISNATTLATGTYSVTVTVGGCTSATGTVSVTVSPTPATPTAGSNSPICAGSTLNLTTPTVGGATYSWTGPNAFSSSSQNPSITNATVAASGTYSVTVTVGGCTSAAGTVTVIVNPTPATPTAGSNSPICAGSTLNLTTPTVGGATYSWTGPNSFSSSSQNPSITNATVAASGTYSVTVTVAGCTSLPGKVTVVVDTIPVVSAGTNQTVCANNDSVKLSGTSTTGTGVWTTSGSGTFSPNNTTLGATYIPSKADTTAGTVTLTLTSTNNGACSAGSAKMVITFTHAPTAEAGLDQTVCANNADVTLSGSFTIATGGIWSSSGSGTFSPNNTNMGATYIPSNADTAAGSVLIILTTTGNGKCKAVTDSMKITITNAPTDNAGIDVSVCANNPDVKLNGKSSTGTGQWTTSGTGSFTPNNTTLNATYIPSATDITNGSVTLVLTTTNNGTCLAVTDTMVITITSPPTVVAGPNVVVCANNDSVKLSGTSSTGSGVWTTSGTGTFSPNSATLNATYVPSNADTTAGSVTLTLTSANNGGCLAITDKLTITFTHAPTAEAGVNVSVCSNNPDVTLSGSFTIATGGVWSTTGSGSFSPNNTNMGAAYIPSNADTAAGSVFIILTTTGNGTCKAVTDSMKITYTDAPHVEAGNDTTVCLSSPNYKLNGYSSTGSGTWTTLGSGTFSPNNTTLNATYDPSTADTTAKKVTLILTSSNNGGCSPVSDTIVLTYSTVPTATAGTNQTVCANNADVSLNATSSTGTGVWTTSGTGTFTPNNTTLNATYVPSAADTTAKTVTLTFTATGGCVPVSKSIVITITPAPDVNAGPDLFICKNASLVATLSGSVGGGASKGKWTTLGSGTFSPNDSALNASYTPSTADTTAGRATLILTSTNNGNCLPVTDTIVIHYTTPPEVEAGTNLSGCANNSIPLNGIVTGGSGTGIWTTPNGSGVFSPNNTTLNGSYTPSNADTAVGNVILILTSTNNGGCAAVSDSIIITVTPGPIVNAGNDQTVCKNNNNVTLNGGITHASGGKWSTTGSGSFLPNDSALSVTYIPSSADTAAGSVKIILTSSGNGACQSATDTMVITFSPAPDVNAGSTIYICTGTMTASLNGSVSGGATTGKWTTNGTGTFSPNDSTLNATYNLSSADTAAKTIVLTLTSTNNGGCLAVKDTVVIKITPVPFVKAGHDTTVCANNPNINLSGLVIGGSGTGVWTTRGSGTFSPNDSALNAGYSPSSGDTAAKKVTLVLTATNACLPASDSITITFTPAPTVNPGANQAICAGDVVNLSGTVGIATGGIWTTSGNGSFSPNDSALSTTYIPGSADTASGTAVLVLTTTGNGNCIAVKDSIVVTIQSKPKANFTSSPACLNSSINFTDASTVAKGNITGWFWNFSNGTATTQNTTNTFTSTGNQTITLAVSTSAGCKDTITKNIFVNPLPTAGYLGNSYCPDSAMFTDKSSVTPGNVKSWTWTFGDSTGSSLQNPTHTYANPGTYTVTLIVMSDSGCTGSYFDTITVEKCPDNNVGAPAVPSAFTPDGDGINDLLLVKGGPFSQLDFRVFDEWGNQLFRATSQSQGWDGKFNGKPQPDGTYTWTLVGTTVNGKSYKMTGDVTILR
jgi:gliding motility-associated-like protein